MKRFYSLALVLVLGAASAGTLEAGQVAWGSQSAFATAPAVANTFGNDVVALLNTHGAPATVVVNDPGLHANGALGPLNTGQASFFQFNSFPNSAPFKTSPGTTQTAYHSWALRKIGDVDGDGWEDVAIGATQVGSGPGYFQAISGDPSVTFPNDIIYQVNGPATGTLYGGGLDVIDIGQGPDILVAGIGMVEVRDDATGGLLAGPVNFPSGFSPIRAFTEHFSIRTVGDVNFNGIQDFAVGDHFNDLVLVMEGSAAAFGSIIHTLSGPTGTFFGYSIAPMGDVNNDGAADFLVGAPNDSGNQGIVYLYDGATGGVLSQITGNTPNAFFGYSVDGNFDLDGDMSMDGIVGAPGDAATSVAGSVQTLRVTSTGGTPVLTPLYQPSTSPAPPGRVPANLPGPVYGRNVAGLGDLNGNPYSEYAVGVPQDPAATGSGHNIVYTGGPLASIVSIGNGCGTPPLLLLGGMASPGSSINPLVISGATPNAAGALLIGSPGTAPPCFDLVATPAPIPINFTLAGGVAFPPPIPIPINPTLVGSPPLRFQAVIPTDTGLNVSNSFEVRIGLW